MSKKFPKCFIGVIIVAVLLVASVAGFVYASGDPYPEADDEYYDNEDEYYENDDEYYDDSDDYYGDEDPYPEGACGSFTDYLNPIRNYLILVNEEYEYEFGGDYDQALQQDLVYLPDCYGEATPIEKAAGKAFTELKQALANQGIKIELYSAYRTKEDQEWVYDYYSSLDGWSDTNYVAEPGFSEHHTGLLLNIVAWWPEIAAWATETPERTAEDPDFFGKIHAALPDFGFIDRYPEYAEEITGYPCEPYEIRFVGSSEIAHEIMDNDLCLEEYLGVCY